jgi:hypothetical protein
MNLATIIVDTDRDIGVVAATNFLAIRPTTRSKAIETLYRRHAA